MHLPPAAQVSIGKSSSHLFILVGFAGVYVSLLVAVLGSIGPGAFAGLALACTVVLAYAAWRWCSSPVGLLAWTGREWIWQQGQDQQKCSVRWCADLQTMVLLRLQTKSQARQQHWLWVERNAHSTASWLAFRRALVADTNEPSEELEGASDSAWDYLSPPQRPHLFPSPALQGARRPIPGIQNSTQR